MDERRQGAPRGRVAVYRRARTVCVAPKKRSRRRTRSVLFRNGFMRVEILERRACRKPKPVSRMPDPATEPACVGPSCHNGGMPQACGESVALNPGRSFFHYRSLAPCVTVKRPKPMNSPVIRLNALLIAILAVAALSTFPEGSAAVTQAVDMQVP